MDAAAALIPGISRMNPMTALCLGLAGVALVAPRRTWPAGSARVRLALAVVIAGVSTVKLVAAGAGPAPGVDLLIFAESVKRFERSLMAPTTALGLVLLGAALALTASSARRAVLAAQLCAAGALGVGTMGLIGHLYGAITLVEFGRAGTASASAMSLPTAICMISAAVGTL